MPGDWVTRVSPDVRGGPRVGALDGGNVITARSDDGPGRGNRILTALPDAERVQFSEAASNVTLDARTVLFEPGRSIDAVYFPTDGVISLVTLLHDGAIVEVATIGNEGIVGVPLVPLGALAVRAIPQVASRGLRVDAAVFTEWFERSHTFQTLVDRYTQALFGQIAQAAACNRYHSSKERLSRWLLMSQDRVGCNHFLITQEFLGQMLGTQRSTVSVSAGLLQRDGLIRYTRGHVTIVDREALEAVSCECYAVIKAELDRWFDDQSLMRISIRRTPHASRCWTLSIALEGRSTNRTVCTWRSDAPVCRPRRFACAMGRSAV
jgi:CRP-like cAMP-binding protein